MAQLEARARAAFPGFDVINEGDHVHVEPSRNMRPGSATAAAPPSEAPQVSAPQPALPVPELPPAMARPNAPKAVGATRSPLLAAAYRLMVDANPYESAAGQDMYNRGLAEQGDMDEAAAGREQSIRTTGYNSELNMYADDVNARRAAQIGERTSAIAENNKRENAYVDYLRDAAEKERDRRVRVEEANIAANARLTEAGMTAAARAAAGKPLPANIVNKLVAGGSGVDMIENINNTFDPRYVGRPVAGGTQIAINKVIGGDKPMADWWQQYQQWITDVRHAKFGASLTAGETAAFNRFIVTPSMNAATAKSNLARQKEVLETVLGRTSRVFGRTYDPVAISEAIGRDPATLGTQQQNTPTDTLSDADLLKMYGVN